ncbi:AraC family transcriptional regulator [Dinghuibacter silviterrae]|uniref:AraC family transcriptional regulator n=1 Tax=Dinghuibacter silviterrae TaxID=1539049 RepID=A0A4R8DIE7_9BACT|nr:AraC family transcriptional regulator [Dinghuibacter silviterrae]TDW97513.1 AraC family transcriptional regulator [Dinghuibacter silviterrae]
MPAPRLIPLTEPRRLQTLVENRRVFNLEHCELNIYESYEEAYRVPLTFPDFVVTSMIRGKKVMHIFGDPAFDYLPGESVIAPAGETMVIDFPEAREQSPTQCIALTVDAGYVRDTVHFLDDVYQGEGAHWTLRFNRYHFDNEAEITSLINKLIRVCSSGDKAKNIYADLNLKELLIRLLQSQHLFQIQSEAGQQENHSRLHYVLHYIHEHLTERIPVDTLSRKAYLSRNMFFKWFKEQFGLTPLEYVNRERIRLAKQLLAETHGSISDVSFRCGFSDVNYFVRMFRKMEGVTPGAYRRR